METTQTPAEARDNRADMMRLLQAEKPDIDLDDENAIFGQIIDDYADYARLLEAERLQREADSSRQRMVEQTSATFGAGQPTELALAAKQWLDNMAGQISAGNYSASAFDMAVKAMNYDRDVQAAEIRGRNTQISASIMRVPSGDGVPRLGSSAAASAAQPSIFDIARGR